MSSKNVINGREVRTQGGRLVFASQKYGRIPMDPLRFYNGILYDSRAEADKAKELDILLRAGVIAGWDRQIPFVLHALGGEAIGRFVIDFRITWPDGKVTYVEVKGAETAEFRWKRRHFEAEYKGLDYSIEFIGKSRRKGRQ
jgi:hypothetical protein